MRVVLALTAVCFALGMVQKADCYQDTWSNGHARYTHMCYSDLPYLYTGRGFAELNWPYTDDAQVRARYEVMEYPVGISYWAWGTAWVTHWAERLTRTSSARYGRVADALRRPGRESEIRLFVAVNALGLAALALLAAWLLAGVNPRRPWDAAVFALSPRWPLTGLVNWDLLAVGLRRRRALGLGAGPAGAHRGADRARRRHQALPAVPARRAAGDLRCGAPVRAVPARGRGARAPGWSPTPRRTSRARDQWKVFWSFNSDRGADLGSSGWCSTQADRRRVDVHTINLWSWLFFGAWCLGVLVLGLAAPQTPRLAQLGFLVVAGFLLVNKVYSPQYVLWLLPLAVLARPALARPDRLAGRRALLLRRACGGTSAGTWHPPAATTPASYWVAILVRMAAELYLVALVARDVLRPAVRPGARRGRRRQASDRPGRTRSRCSGPARRPRRRRRARGAPCGRNSIEACMCGGSAKSRCLPSIENGERTKPTASRPPRARVAARAFSDDSPVGASRPMPWAVPPLTTRM